MQFKEYIANLPPYKPASLTSLQTSDMVKLSSNENALGASPRALEAIQGALSSVYRYPDAGASALRAALARHVDLAPEMIVCSNGSDEMIALLCLALLREGDEVVMAEGTFISYLLRTLTMGGQPVFVPMRDYTHDLPALAQAITPRTRLLFVCNPNNPTGTTIGADAMHKLLASVPDEVLVVVDEAYIEYVVRPDYPDLLPELRSGRKNIILLRTFAKIYGLAGLRLGYAFAQPALIDYLNRARNIYNVNALAQAAGVAALQDHEHVTRSRAHAAESRAFFQRELSALGLQPIPTETNFIAVHVGDDASASAGLRERGFTVMALTGWKVPGCLRISFGTHEQNQRFIAALRDVLGKA